MKALTWLVHGAFDGLSLSRCRRRSIGLGSLHLIQSCRRISIGTSDYSPAASEDPPSWAMLNCIGRSSDSIVADAKTMADSPILDHATGRYLRVFFNINTPPASSFLYYQWAGGAPVGREHLREPEVIAVHEDSVLLQASPKSSGIKESPRELVNSSSEVSLQIITAHGNTILLELISNVYSIITTTYDYFVHRVSASAAWLPPSLSLLPTRDRDLVMECEDEDEESMSWSRVMEHNKLDPRYTGLLRRGADDDEFMVVEMGVVHRDHEPDSVDLCVLCPGSHEWKLSQDVPIIREEGSRGDKLQRWRYSDRVVPIGDRFLCWVNYGNGFLFFDVTEEDPVLRLDGPMTWIREGVLDCDELWAMPGYQGLPYLMPQYPIVSSDNPNIVFFTLRDGAQAVWRIKVDTWTKQLLSIVQTFDIPGRGSCERSQHAFTVSAWNMSLTSDGPLTWLKDTVLDCQEILTHPGYEGLPCVYPTCPVIISLHNPDVVLLKVSGGWMIEVDMRAVGTAASKEEAWCSPTMTTDTSCDMMKEDTGVLHRGGEDGSVVLVRIAGSDILTIESELDTIRDKSRV
ncbi:hypothetical protein QOZ80_9BG0694600 [Eleusine coracana subsp. coracana]|nr:hypothetical protein QOZ80_9BG0694600 [Eleusine coracana subsp. coracana]